MKEFVAVGDTYVSKRTSIHAYLPGCRCCSHWTANSTYPMAFATSPTVMAFEGRARRAKAPPLRTVGLNSPVQVPMAEPTVKIQAQKAVATEEEMVVAVEAAGVVVTSGLRPRASPNPSFERTHTGVRRLALISFWANLRTPVWAAQLKR